MASCTRVTKARRHLRKLKAAKKRKNAVANAGSTLPNLTLNKPNDNEKAQAKQKA